MINQLKSEKIINQAVKIIADNFGADTASLYQKYYAGKTDTEIIQSLTQILTELVGQTNADKQLVEIKTLN